MARRLVLGSLDAGFIDIHGSLDAPFIDIPGSLDGGSGGEPTIDDEDYLLGAERSSVEFLLDAERNSVDFELVI